MNATAAIWRARSTRERRVVSILALVAAVALVAAFAWLPLERTRHRLSQELPALRASAAAMERQAEEVKRLRAMPAATSATAVPLASAASSGELARGLSGAQVSVMNEKTVAASGGDLSYGALLEWIARMQASYGLRVEQARIEALPLAGSVARRKIA
jgi:general secretion pathway protein M